MALESNTPSGPIEDRWTTRKTELKLIGPTNRRKYDVIVVGSGLAGAAAAATLGEQGFNVKVFTFHDSPRRAHSIAAQGGINAAKNYQNDGDSTFRLFYDTVKGGDFRARESNVYRLAEVSTNIIDQCAAQGVPFAREYAGTLSNRTFGGVLVSRTFYARGQTGQQLLLGAYSSLMRQTDTGKCKMYTRHEMLDVIVVDGRARGIIVRDLVTGELEVHTAHCVVLATGGYSNVYYWSTNAKGCNVTATWRAHRRGAFMANPCFTQIHPTCIPAKGEQQSKLTLMSESLRNDGRVWVPKKKEDSRPAAQVPEDERDYFLETKYPTFGNMVPRDVASRNAKYVCDQGKGVGTTGRAVYLDFAAAIKRDGEDVVRAKYGNLFDMYAKISGENPYKSPMAIYPAPHYTMGGLWVDYHLMSNIPGLFVLGEANFSDHGANRLGASALMQGLADGYFIASYTVSNYLSNYKLEQVSADHPACKSTLADVKSRTDKLLAIKGTRPVDEFHRELGNLMLDKVGMSRSKEGLEHTIERILQIKGQFYTDLRITGTAENINQDLEKAGRVADFLEFAELMARDALSRNESCGGHFREEYQTPEGEALRDDDNYAYTAAWEWKGESTPQTLHKEQLTFDYVKLSQRSYK